MNQAVLIDLLKDSNREAFYIFMQNFLAYCSDFKKDFNFINFTDFAISLGVHDLTVYTTDKIIDLGLVERWNKCDSLGYPLYIIAFRSEKGANNSVVHELLPEITKDLNV